VGFEVPSVLVWAVAVFKLGLNGNDRSGTKNRGRSDEEKGKGNEGGREMRLRLTNF
jgi:hypothetical protein